MNFTAAASVLAPALAHAAALVQDKAAKRIPTLGAVRLRADATALVVSLNNGDAQVSLSVAAEVLEAGELAVSAGRLADLTASFPKTATVEIVREGNLAVVRAGRSRFRLPILPTSDLSVLALANEVGRTTIAQTEAVRLFTWPTFALSKEETRYYLAGVFIYDADDDLVGVATDDKRLARITIAAAAGLSQDRSCIVPPAAAKAVGKLLAAHRDVEQVVLRRSRTLLEVEAPDCFRFITKLIDAQYPMYERVIGTNDGSNIVVADRGELASAVARIAAVIGDTAFVGLSWPGPDGALCLTALADRDAAHDVVVPQAMRGSATTAIRTDYAAAALDAFVRCDTIMIDAGQVPSAPVWITSAAGGDGLLIVQMPYRAANAPAQRAEVAA
jgi:DNA polymerase-3 subunit beta